MNLRWSSTINFVVLAQLYQIFLGFFGIASYMRSCITGNESIDHLGADFTTRRLGKRRCSLKYSRNCWRFNPHRLLFSMYIEKGKWEKISRPYSSLESFLLLQYCGKLSFMALAHSSTLCPLLTRRALMMLTPVIFWY